MLIDFRGTALYGMRDRRIQPAEVIYTIEHPDITYKNKTGKLIIYEEHPGGRLIVAAVDAYSSRWVVSVRDYRWEDRK